MIVARTVWGANPASLPRVRMRLPATQVFVHHSVTAVTPDPYHDMRTIESIGLQRFGQFPYSFCVHPDGRVLEGCGLQRGAHTAGRNSTSFGICWIGNYDDRAPKLVQVDATRQLLAHLETEGWLVPVADILGHRDVAATACPGSKVYSILDLIRHRWEETMPPDDPNVPNLPDIKFFVPVVNTQTGECRGYYIVSSDGQLHAFGPGAPFHGRSEVPR